ncbi:MAG: family 78 glycoside hydrolase catalytic domain [Faecousia sp.]
MRITNCAVNHLVNPLSFAMESCTFSWVTEDAVGKRQTDARIVVKRGRETAADTGWADLDSLATTVAFSLSPRTRYTWTVAVRTDAGEEAVSEENWFETGKMDEPWSAKWIGCDDSEPRHPVFTKEIVPEKEVTAARLYICGLGLYEAGWNGKKIGGEYLTPYCNNYHSWVQYQTYDVTEQLQSSGKLSVELGNGWYKGRFGFDRSQKPYYGDSWKLLAELHLTYADGSREIIGTDESWTVTRSPITFSNIYDGEHRDDTLPEVEAVPARLVDAPRGKLTERYSTPVAVRKEMPVKEIIHTPAGETVIDLGQNMTGVFRLAVHEPAGAKIRLRFGEILQGGNFYRDNLRSAKAEYIYVSDGQPHILEPKFTFYGFRYVKVEGVSDLKPENFTALVLHSELPETGRLETGNPLINQLISNIRWGQIGNFLDVPTDCPQRDERMGWTGDAQVFAATALYQRDCYAFYRKFLHDIWTEQQAHQGMVPDVIPSFGKDGASAAWGDAACIIPWTVYEFYGDKTILQDQYDSMAAWVDYITCVDGSDNGWRRHFHYGDWLALDGANDEDLRGGTDVGLIASTQYRLCAELTAKAARVLGKTADAEKYEALADHILSEIRREYFSPSGRCAVPTQTGLLLTAKYGLSVDPNRAETDLVNKLNRDEGKLKTGFVGTPLLCPVLTQGGHSDMAFDLLLNEDYPGWLYAVKLGATTVWERWNSVDENGKIAENGMNSLNHYSYGSIAQWLYQDAAGIAPAAPGFRRANLRPHLNAFVGKMEAQYHSAAGCWKACWEVLENGDISYSCTVPFGCTAELELPYGGGHYELEPGAFQRTYTPNAPVRTVYSTKMPLRELLGVPRVKAALSRMIPQITQLPASMQEMSMRELAARMGGGVKEEMFDQMDVVLAKL